MRYLGIALALIVGFMLLEVIVAVTSGSLVLLADAGHMLSDAGAIGASLWAIRLAARPAHGVWTFGFKRAEIDPVRRRQRHNPARGRRPDRI